MLKFGFALKKGHPLKILCLGAHSDDIEIGCGGTILRFLEEYKESSVSWIVFAANAERRAEAESSASLFLGKAARQDILIKDFRESYFPYSGDIIKDFFEVLRQKIGPDIIFTHYRHDLHQDHRLVSELTWNTFRDHHILEYEIMKYDGDIGTPNCFVQLDQHTCRKKISHILKSFKSQSGHHWFSEDAFLSLLRLRGIECNAPEKYAEAFYCRKIAI
jgi:LmbE family N-acetylglucosaminyl deacetylase